MRKRRRGLEDSRIGSAARAARSARRSCASPDRSRPQAFVRRSFSPGSHRIRGTLRSGADCRACRDARRPVPGRRARFARNAAVAARKSGPTAGSRPSARGSRSARRLTRKPPARARLDSRAVRARPPVLRPPAPRSGHPAPRSRPSGPRCPRAGPPFPRQRLRVIFHRDGSREHPDLGASVRGNRPPGKDCAARRPDKAAAGRGRRRARRRARNRPPCRRPRGPPHRGGGRPARAATAGARLSAPAP